MYGLDNFCNTLLRLRKERGWTQTELAERIGIAPQSVSKWECAIGNPDVTLFPVIAGVFSVPIGVLFGEKWVEPDRRFGSAISRLSTNRLHFHYNLNKAFLVIFLML